MRISYPRLLSAVRMAQDCLARVLDRLNPEDWDSDSLDYLARQLDLASDFCLEATDLIERRFHERRTGRPAHLNSDGRGGRPGPGEQPREFD
jgi:hypothetical protein